MSGKTKTVEKIKLPWKQVASMVWPYVKKKVVEQIQAVWLIVLYLVLFQTLILGIPVMGAAVISLGVGLVIMGLAFFMEGLMLGLMPLGEMIGVKIPQKSGLPTILTFSFILGMGATFAEPAVGILKVAGSTVKAWEAPLLFLLLNKYSDYLVYSVGVGVGIAVVFGMLRFMYTWSLKPFIFVLYGILLALSAWALFEPNMEFLSGLAWDCGGVTTGPVTVPLVLALGIGISRVVSKGGDGGGGFGVVTLASVFPIITVLLLGAAFLSSVPSPMSETDFLKVENRQASSRVFVDDNDMTAYVLRNARTEGQIAYFNNDRAAMLAYITKLQGDEKEATAVLGGADALKRWAIERGDADQRLAVFGSAEAARKAMDEFDSSGATRVDYAELTVRNLVASIQAIIPLSVFFFLVLWFILREKAPRMDELILGIVFAVIGMTIFSAGIELGLSRLGGQVGEKLPVAFQSVPMNDQKQVIKNFDPGVVQSAVTSDGSVEKFFFMKQSSQVQTMPYDASGFDEGSRQYTYVPRKGPLYGTEGGIVGILVVLAFAFIMGYGATLAEPALNALGMTVEELTVGTFKKNLLIQAVAIGVGIGMLVGLVKIIWAIPLFWLLAPPYLLLMPITKMSTEEFVNIGWDSAGVTTGPITVPLVLAMGLGIGGQVGVVEGFGILAAASVFPILCVLAVGLVVNRKQKASVKGSAAEAA